MEKEELYARIEELERELAEERIRRKITEDNSDCALWEYEYAGNVREREKDTEKPEPDIAGMETTESFSIKLEQILPWQDGQYAEVFLGIRDYDEISAKMSEEVKNSLLYHLGTHIQKHLKGQEMVCHVKKDEFLLLLDNHVEAAWEKIGHIMIMFEAMIGDKYPDVSINLYSGIYYLESRGYRPEEIFRIGKTLKNKAKRYCTLENSIYENRKSAGNIIDKEAGILNRGNLTRLKGFMNRAAKGERLTVGFIGGSITQGFSATDLDKCYAARIFGWLKKVFPNTEFDYVNWESELPIPSSARREYRKTCFSGCRIWYL